MSEEKKDQPRENSAIGFETHNVPTVYANHGIVTLSFNDIRVYLSEVAPAAVSTEKQNVTTSEALLSPKLSLLMNPEFARDLAAALQRSVQIYEGKFGALRPKPADKDLVKTQT